MSDTALRTLVQHLRLAVLVEDAARRVRFVNAPFCRMFGIDAPPEALLGADCAGAAIASAPLMADPQGFLDGIARALAARAPTRDELDTADGRRFVRDYLPILRDGRSDGHFWVYTDVTEARAARAAAAEAQERADAEAAAREELVAQMTIGLRTPLHVVLGLADLAAEAQDPDEIRHIAASLRRGARQLLWTVDGLLELGGSSANVTEPFDPVQIVEDVAEALAVTAAERDVTILTEIAELPTRILGHPTRIGRALTQVVATALEDVAPGGRLVLALHAAPGDTIELTLTGAGPRPVRRRASHHGLGASIARALVEGLGGSIRSGIVPGGVRVSLPAPPVPGSPAERPLDGLDVAIAVEDPTEAAAVRGLLRLLAARPRAPVPVHALAHLGEGTPPDVVIASGDVVAASPRAAGRPIPTLWLGHALRHPLSRRSVVDAVRAALGRAVTNAPPRPRPGRILVIEDDPSNGAVMRAMLQREGHHVEVHEDGARGFAAFGTGTWDVVLLDLDLPDLPGTEIARRIRAVDPTTPIVACTAQVTPDARRSCELAGMNAFLGKPFTRDRLLAEVDRWLQRGSEVLILDRAPDTRLLYARWLEAAQIPTVEATTEEAAASRIEGGRVSVVLLGASIPDGLRVVPHLRQHGRVRVVWITADVGASEHARALEAGCDAVLSAPVSRAVLVEAARRLRAGPAAPLGAPDDRPRAHVDREIIELVAPYLAARRDDVAAGRAAVARGELALVARLAHRMKGSGASYGFVGVSEIGAAMESVAERGDADGCTAWITALEDYLTRVEVVPV